VIVVQHEEALVVVNKQDGFGGRVGGGCKSDEAEAADKADCRRRDVNVGPAIGLAADGEEKLAVAAACSQILKPVAIVFRLRKRRNGRR
jgi:hypothetical protein